MWNTCSECFSYMAKIDKGYKCLNCGTEVCQLDTPQVFNRKKEIAKKYMKKIKKILAK